MPPSSFPEYSESYLLSCFHPLKVFLVGKGRFLFYFVLFFKRAGPESDYSWWIWNKIQLVWRLDLFTWSLKLYSDGTKSGSKSGVTPVLLWEMSAWGVSSTVLSYGSGGTETVWHWGSDVRLLSSPFLYHRAHLSWPVFVSVSPFVRWS